ncbi:hypothetical protein D5086_032998 [Populus alba]|uniref:Uncharacterized protein n=1 Tax=Populus alba TaxID=43335 RepID=A0ACC4AGF8_POPAL
MVPEVLWRQLACRNYLGKDEVDYRLSARKATIHAVLQDKHACVTCDPDDLANKISYLRLPGYKVLAQVERKEEEEEENRTDKRNESSRYVYSSRFCDCKCYVCLGHVQAILSGVKLRWASGKHISKSPSVSFYPVTDEKKYYKLTFHKRHRQLILGDYLNHVLKEGNEIKVRNRQRKLYTNSGSYWRHVVFQHPASFETLAMEAERKQEIVDDLVIFSKAEDFYARIGRAWKRGYLLFGPPGTGKSTMIAAMANLLNYDIYDLELTAVKDNTELRKLLIETTTRSIIVIEDIDCSLDLTGQRKKKKEEEGERDEKDPKPKLPKEEDSKQSQVTLSGILNFVDGLCHFPLLKSSTSASPENQNHLQGHLQNLLASYISDGLSQIISSLRLKYL